MANKKAILYAILGGLVSAGSIGGVISFALLWKKDNGPKPSIENQNGNAGTTTNPEPTNTGTSGVTVPTSAKKSLQNLPQTIQELKNKYPNYYGSLDNNLKKANLFNALNSIQAKYRNGVGSYDDLWTTYPKAFKDQYDEKDGTMYDIYSEKVGEKDGFNFNMPGGQDKGRHSKPGDTYNREHLIPQSIFGKDRSKPIHNDAHFVYPTDSAINQWRSNFVHDEVTNPSKEGKTSGGNNWKFGLGKNTNNQKAFEPDDHFKGDVARAYLYFMLTWHNYNGIAGNGLASYDPLSPNSFPYFKNNFLTEYINWSHNDPVDLFNVNSNDLIAKEQGGLRNPFVDMPKLIDLIWVA